MINPFFTYGNAIWASNYPNRLACLTLFQKRATRVITKSKHLAHTKQLFDDLSILKFDLLNEYLIGILFYKICNNLMPAQFSGYCIKVCSVHDHHTRSAGGLFVSYARTNLRKFALRCKGPAVSNTIPDCIRNTSPLYKFKKRWREYLLVK